MRHFTIHGADPVKEVTSRAIHHGLAIGEHIQACIRGTDTVLEYVWLGDCVRYVVKGE